MLKKVFSHTILYGLAPQIPKIASFFVLPIITKDLTSTDYGIAGLITAYVAGFSVLQSLGINVNLANSFYKYPSQYKWLWRQLHGFISIWSILFGIILSVILFFVMPSEVGKNTIPVILLNVTPVIFFSTTQIIVFRYYQMSQKPLPLALRSAVLGFVTVFLNLYLISVLKMGYMGWFWSSFISNVLGFLFFFYPIYFSHKLTPIFNFKYKTIKNALKISLPTIPHYYSSYLLNSSDKVVLDILEVETTKIGSYNFAGTFGSYFATVGDALGMAVAPIYNQIYKKAESDVRELRTARDLTIYTQAAFLLVTFFICLWLKEIFEILVSNVELRETYLLAIIIIMGYNYRPMYLGVSTRLFYQEKTKVFLKISFAAGVFNVILNFIFIPIYGITAAAIITFISLMYMGYSGFFLKQYKQYALSHVKYYPVLWLTITIIATVTAYLLVQEDVIVKLFISLMLFVGCTYTFFNIKALWTERK